MEEEVAVVLDLIVETENVNQISTKLVSIVHKIADLVSLFAEMELVNPQKKIVKIAQRTVDLACFLLFAEMGCANQTKTKLVLTAPTIVDPVFLFAEMVTAMEMKHV
jgi:hypothetical protein